MSNYDGNSDFKFYNKNGIDWIKFLDNVSFLC